MDLISVEKEHALCTITICRPNKLNALNVELLKELHLCFSDLTCDQNIRACILTGSGEKAFAAGADVLAMSQMTSFEAMEFSRLGHNVCSQIEHAPFAVLAAVHGFALGGGCELALACDFIYASEGAKFGQPEVSLGVIPGFGGTQRLSRRLGVAKARELCFTGDLVDAREALRLGLVNAVFAPSDLMAKTKECASKIAQKGPLALAQAKKVLLLGENLPLASACELEVQAFSALFATHDQKEGMNAFLQKRKTDFKGK